MSDWWPWFRYQYEVRRAARAWQPIIVIGTRLFMPGRISRFAPPMNDNERTA